MKKLLSIIFILFSSYGFSQQNNPPISVCDGSIQVALDLDGIAILDAKNLDNGSYDIEGEVIYFKVLRVNDSLQYDGGCIDLNGDDDPNSDEVDVWFDDNVGFCFEDSIKTTPTILRVFDKDPGNGPVNPDRMKDNGDLVNHYSDCIVDISVYYIKTPIVACKKYKQIAINAEGIGKINAINFDAGSFCMDKKPVYFKVLRVNDSSQFDNGCAELNGDDNPSSNQFNVWFDDIVYYCCEDVNKKVLTNLRVFNKDPGDGPIDPSRMEKDGDLYKTFSDCQTIVTVKNKIPPVIECKDVEINCNESIDPNINQKLYPTIFSVCDYTLDFSDIQVGGTCSDITRLYTVKSDGFSVSCTQVISFLNTNDSCFDNIAPIPILVDEATIVMNSGYSDVMAKSLDKGRCPIGSLASFDDITPRIGLFFTYSEYIPRFWDNPSNWAKQYSEYGKYFFDPNTGNISTEDKYLKGKADAWIPAERTSKRKFLCSNLSGNNLNLKVYVWDKFAYNTDKDYNNFNFGVVKVKFTHCSGGFSYSKEVNNEIHLFQNKPNPFAERTIISFELPQKTEYNLSIFNINGQLVYKSNGIGKKGKNDIEIDSKSLRSGIYFYKLDTNLFSAIKKMIKL